MGKLASQCCGGGRPEQKLSRLLVSGCGGPTTPLPVRLARGIFTSLYALGLPAGSLLAWLSYGLMRWRCPCRCRDVALRISVVWMRMLHHQA